MRTPLLLTATLILAVAFIYYAGNFTPTDTPRPLTNPTVQTTTATPAPNAPLTLDQARQLTSPQRLALIKKALGSYESGRSYDYLCSLIAALTKDELSEASAIIYKWEILDPFLPLEATEILDIREKTAILNDKERIRETLARQWGRVAPDTWFETAKIDGVFTPDLQDSFEVMKGWIETEPDAAFAWAQTANNNEAELLIAAQVLTLSAAGDPQKLADSLLAFPAGDERVKNCLYDYYETVGNTSGNTDAALIYGNLPHALQKPAWSITMKSLNEADLQAAVDWFTLHFDDPGRDYRITRTLFEDLSDQDPAGTAQWASSFPDDPVWPKTDHPCYVSTMTWFYKDPAAAKAWLQTQPSTLHWVEESFKAIEEMDSPKKPEADKTEN